MSWDVNDMDFDGDLNHESKQILPGWYQLQISKYESKCDKQDRGEKHEFTVDVIGTINDAAYVNVIGLKIWYTLYSWTKFYKKSAICLGVACGYWDTKTLNDAKKKGIQVPEPNFEDFVGMSFVARVELEEYDATDGSKKKRANIAKMYSIYSNEAKESGVQLVSVVPEHSSAESGESSEDDIFA